MHEDQEYYTLLINDNKESKYKFQNEDTVSKKKVLKYFFSTFIITSILGILFRYMTKYQIIYVNENADIEDVKVSVIIPTYNTEEYIDRCMKSVLASTLKEIEVICIDDCSTDNSLSVLRKYVDLDPRVKVIHLMKNRGSSYGRNAAMKIARGEFIGFLDSDDIIDEKFFENLYNQSKGYDIVVGKLCDSTNDTDDCIPVDLPLIHGYVGDSIWRKEFLENNGITFPVGKVIQEDKVFRSNAYDYNPKIININEDYFYYYKKREGSVRKLSKDYINDMNERIKSYNDKKKEEN